MIEPNRYPAAPSAARRPVDILGIVSVVVAGVALLSALAVFLIGLVPELNAIWWLGIVLIPILGFVGFVALVLGVIGIVVAARRGGRFVWSIVGIVLGVLMLLPIGWLFLGPSV